MKKTICRNLKILIYTIFLAGILCSCEKSPDPNIETETWDVTETSETTEETEVVSTETTASELECKSLRVYENDSHTFAVWDYDKSNETMTLLFDGTKVVCSYFVFEEMNAEETITLYNGSDNEYIWRIQVSYNNIEDTYSIFLGDSENKLLYGQEDFSGEYFFKEETEISLTGVALDNPLSFEVVQRAQDEKTSERHTCRATGIWHHTVNITDTQTLMIYEEGIFELHYISAGEVKETVTGIYTILSDDGQYQEFEFVSTENANQIWTAKLWQTELKDSAGVAYDGIVYINSENETMYYTGTKW